MLKVVYYFRLVLYTVILLSVSFLAVFIGLVSTILGKRLNTNYYVARTFYFLAGSLLGWKLEVEGEEHLWTMKNVGGEGIDGEASTTGRSAVMLANHQSFVDIMFIGRIMPKHAAIMAKKELKWIPGLGWFMLLSGTVFINRGNNKSAVASMTQAGKDMMRKRISLFIFPEGTRNQGPEADLLPFKKGAFYLAVESGIPIVPIVCQNYNHLFDGKTRFKSGTLRVKVLPPIPTTGMTAADVPALVEKTRNLMLETLRSLSDPLNIAPQTPSETASVTPLLRSSDNIGYETNNTTTTSLGGVSESEQLQGAVVGASSEDGKKDDRKKYVIAMVSDFFLPVVGGVEGHIYSLGIELMRRGHRVIVITHHHGDRVGVRYLSGIKVYHLPILPISSQDTLPNFLLFLPYFRDIVLRERVEVVHAHGSLSALGHEALYHAPLFGLKTVFTDHSLFGFGDAVGILTNKLLAGALCNLDAGICVSNTGRENTVLRGEIEPGLISVIPNALVADHFTPKPRNTVHKSDKITIVVISRLVYRKGVDLLVASAPQICDLFPEVQFVVGGDGPKMVDLEQMREKYQLQDRIELLGSVRPQDVRDVLVRGEIYLNTSLTEAFGISIIEAACAGLFVVSTKVGGVPEILPDDMIEFARADEDDVTRALSRAIQTIKEGRHDPHKAHARVREMYSWADVAERTELVYERAIKTPHKDTFERLSRSWQLGIFFGPILCIIQAVQHYFLYLIEFLRPEDEIEEVEAHWDPVQFAKECQREKAMLSQ